MTDRVLWPGGDIRPALYYFNNTIIMKKFFLLAFVLLVCGCAGMKEQIGELDDRLTVLESQVESLQSKVDDLQNLISGKKFISDVRENEDGSYTLLIINSAGVQSSITVKDGDDGSSPQIGVKEEDGVMYWTIDGEFVLDGEGQKLPVAGEDGNDGVTPQFKIEEGYWYVSYDNGTSWQECGKAQADADPSVFKGVELSEDGKLVHITLADDSVLTLEIYRQFGIVFEPSEEFVGPGETVSVPFSLTGADENAVVEAIAGEGWKAEVKLAEDGLSGTIEITAPAEGSTGKVIVLANDGGYKTVMRTLTFITGVLNISTSSVEVPASGGAVSVDVETDMDYEVSIPEDAQSWISVVETKGELREETISFSVSANDTDFPRQAEVGLVSGGATVETILIFQIADYEPDVMVLQVNAQEYTSSSAAKYSNQVYLPLYGNVDVTVNWGDGTSETVQKDITTVNARAFHTYAESGTYYVTIKGTAEEINGSNINKNIAPAITAVLQWGTLGATSLDGAFRYNTSITSVPEPSDGAFAAVTKAGNMFDGCTSLLSVPENLLSAATGLTDVGSMFNDCASLTAIPAGLFASCPAITDMSSLFVGCASLKEIPADLFSKQTEVTNMANLFKECTAIETVPENLFASQTKVTNISSMFNLCSSLKSVPAGLFAGMSSVTNIATMFKGCSALETVPEGLLDVFTKVTNINSLFSGCSSLGNLPSDVFKNLSAVTTASYLYEDCVRMTEFPSISHMTSLKTVPGMWKGCSAITTVPADYFPSSVSTGTSAAYMFQNCTSLVSVPEGLFDDFASVTTMNQMFENCTSLASLPTGIFDSMVKVTSANLVFNGCSNFTGESPYTVVDGVKVHLYERSTENGFAVIKNHNDTFAGCEKMADYSYIPIDWGGISDGTKDVPVLVLSMTPKSGTEYYEFDVNIKGTDVKSCKYVLGTKEIVELRVEEMGGYEQLCNRYGASFTDANIDNINSETGYSISATDMEAGTEYMLVVMAKNVHGTTIEAVTASTEPAPEGEADYERYIGTWTVTSASSEITGQPQTFTVTVEPYRVNESFLVSGWGITTMGDRDTAPFIMDYADGNVSVSTGDYYGMVGMYYVYLRYRFQQNGKPYVWVTDNALCTGTYGSDGSVTLTMGKFTLPSDGQEYQVTGMDYTLYSGGQYYESLDLFKPGYTVSDYSVGPYTLTRSGEASGAVRKAASVRAGSGFAGSSAYAGAGMPSSSEAGFIQLQTGTRSKPDAASVRKGASQVRTL